MYGKFETVLKYFKACLKSLNFMRRYICASRLIKGKAKHIYMRIALKGLNNKYYIHNLSLNTTCEEVFIIYINISSNKLYSYFYFL